MEIVPQKGGALVSKMTLKDCKHTNVLVFTVGSFQRCYNADSGFVSTARTVENIGGICFDLPYCLFGYF